MKLLPLSLRLLPLALACGLAPSLASAQSSAIVAPTVITTVPYTITASGKYVLGGDLTNTAGGAAITISVANVSLDLGGYFVSGSGDMSSPNPLISVGDVAGVSIKNGTLANEGVGIEFTGTSDPRDYAVEGVIFTHLYEYGVAFDSLAIAGKVYGCKFSDLGGTTLSTFIIAIATNGGVRSEKNTIDTLTPPADEVAVGIFTEAPAVGSDFAIGNTIANCQFGIFGNTYLNNLTTNVQNSFGGDAATGNLAVPANTDDE